MYKLQQFNDLKKSILHDAMATSIPITNTNKKIVGKLVPTGTWILENKSLLQSMSEWRNRVKNMFLAQSVSTYESTKHYIENLAIGDPKRILFMIQDFKDNFIGHIGCISIDYQTIELDNLIRGIPTEDNTLILDTEISLLDWCFKKQNLLRVCLHVFSHNWITTSLHKKVGFKINERLYLKKENKDGFYYHEIVDLSESNTKYTLNKMEIDKISFYDHNTTYR